MSTTRGASTDSTVGHAAARVGIIRTIIRTIIIDRLP